MSVGEANGPTVVTHLPYAVREIEHVWIEPPGISLQARVDTGASRNSLNRIRTLPVSLSPTISSFSRLNSSGDDRQGIF